eukprot:1311482-Rhodomonas_salina.2
MGAWLRAEKACSVLRTTRVSAFLVWVCVPVSLSPSLPPSLPPSLSLCLSVSLSLCAGAVAAARGPRAAAGEHAGGEGGRRGGEGSAGRGAGADGRGAEEGERGDWRARERGAAAGRRSGQLLAAPLACPCLSCLTVSGGLLPMRREQQRRGWKRLDGRQGREGAECRGRGQVLREEGSGRFWRRRRRGAARSASACWRRPTEWRSRSARGEMQRRGS